MYDNYLDFRSVSDKTRSSSDPFLVSTNTSTRVQLSPTAASFTPFGVADNVLSRSKAPSLSRGFSGVGYLTASSDIDPCEARNGPLQASDRYSLKYGVIGNSQADTRNRPNIMDYQTFGSENHSRALVIENVPKNLTYMSLAGFFNVSGQVQEEEQTYISCPDQNR